MEVPFEIKQEEDEVVEMNLQTRKRSHHNKKIQSPTSSESSSITSESSDNTSFENSATMNTSFITNGEKPIIIEDRSAFSEAVVVPVDEVEKEYNLESNTENGNNVGENGNGTLTISNYEGTNGFSMQQNGAGVADSLPESDAGDKKVDVGSIGTNFSKSPETAIGFKYVESLLDENSNGVNVTTPDILTVEQNIVNKILKGGQNELALEATEFDVEGVLQKQETHDLFCPNCNSCITKRVILRRRKRKIQEISMGEEANSSKHGEIALPAVPDGNLDTIVEQGPENGTSPIDRAPDASVDAVTCLSCFSIFIPTRNGFLFWRRKPDIILQPDQTSAEPAHDIAHLAEKHFLPTEVEISAGETLAHDEGTGKVFPLWILTCCQPHYRDEKKPEQPEKPDTDVPTRGITFPSPPSYGVAPTSKPPTTPDADMDAPTRGITFPSPPSYGVAPKSEPPTKPDAATPSPNKPAQLTPDGDVPLRPDSVPRVTPDGDIPLPPELKPLIARDTGNELIVQMPEEPAKDQNLSVIKPDDTPPQSRPFTDIEAPLIESSPVPRGHGVSGLDIIKAIVYGGLLESIASLSVISSAAGGDATTLNIVALGLANVFGGLLVLLHNLRVLKREHTSQHYEDQLGQRGQFALHATIAVVSYLVFGMMPPLVYGFSFRKSDDKNLKLVTLAAASLVCIIVLSSGKSYVRRPQKKYIQTVFYYASVGVMVSGLGYVSGELVNDLLKKLGVFDSRSAVTMPVLGAGATKQAWSSY